MKCDTTFNAFNTLFYFLNKTILIVFEFFPKTNSLGLILNTASASSSFEVGQFYILIQYLINPLLALLEKI